MGEVLDLDIRVGDIGQVGPGQEHVAVNEPDIEPKATRCFEVAVLRDADRGVVQSLLCERGEEGLELIIDYRRRRRGPKRTGEPLGDLLEADQGGLALCNLICYSHCTLGNVAGLNLVVGCPYRCSEVRE